MTHREQLAILALIVFLVLLAILFPRQTGADVPVAPGVVPAGEFVPVKGGQNHVRLSPGSATPGATHSTLRVPAGTEKSARPAATPSPLDGNRASDVVLAPANVAPTPSPSASLRVPTASVTGISGAASWFASPVGVSAAGPVLRTALGPGWRGTRVHVTGPAGSATTILGDWMRADRLIDLDDDVFPAVCGPLSRGICEAKVTW